MSDNTCCRGSSFTNRARILAWLVAAVLVFQQQMLAINFQQAGVIQEAKTLIAQGRMQQASSILSPWLQDHPDDAQALKLMGRVLFSHAEQLRGQKETSLKVQAAYGRAQRTFERAFQLGARGVSLHHALAYCYKVTGSYRKAIDQIESALVERPDESSLLTLRAQCFIALEETSAARKDLEKAIKGAPGIVQAHILLARLLSSKGEREQAIELLWAFYHRLPKKVDKRHAKALSQIYLLALASTDVDLAIKALKILVQHDSTNSVPRVELGICYYRKGMFQEAREELTPVINGEYAATKSMVGTAHHYVGLLDKHGKLFEQAAKHFEEALRRVPNDSKSLQNLAACYKKLGNLTQARVLIAQLKRVAPINNELRLARRRIQGNSQDSDARVRLVQSLLRLERFEEAQIELQTFSMFFPRHKLLPGFRRELQRRRNMNKGQPKQ